MRYLAAEPVALAPLSAGILLANQDINQAPMHVTIVGATAHPDAIALHQAALRNIVSHEWIELRSPTDSAPSEVAYPHLDRAALFLCTATACSSPVFEPGQVRAKIEHAQLQPQLR